MKKFYKIAESGTAPGGHVVRLDGKLVKTPMHHPLIVDSPTLAAAMAQEWEAQGDEIVPSSMPMTQLANTLIDKGRGHDRAQMEETLCDYAASDLVCYFADHPQDLIQRQEKRWLPLLEWMEKTFSVPLERVVGIQYHHQPQDSLDTIARLIAALTPEEFVVVQAVVHTTGSLVIALALLHGVLSEEEAWEAACVDEIYQLEKWGEDADARQRLDMIKADIRAIKAFHALVSARA